jgi:hypothetical protein
MSIGFVMRKVGGYTGTSLHPDNEEFEKSVYTQSCTHCGKCIAEHDLTTEDKATEDASFTNPFLAIRKFMFSERYNVVSSFLKKRNGLLGTTK